MPPGHPSSAPPPALPPPCAAVCRSSARSTRLSWSWAPSAWAWSASFCFGWAPACAAPKRRGEPGASRAPRLPLPLALHSGTSGAAAWHPTACLHQPARPCKCTAACQAASWTAPRHPPFWSRRSKRQRYFADTGAVFLGIAVIYSATFVATLGATLAQPDCGYPWDVMAALEFVRVGGCGAGGARRPPRGGVRADGGCCGLICWEQLLAGGRSGWMRALPRHTGMNTWQRWQAELQAGPMERACMLPALGPALLPCGQPRAPPRPPGCSAWRCPS